MTDPYGQLAPLYDRMAADPAIRGLYRELRRARWVRQDLTSLSLDVSAGVATFRQLWFVRQAKLYRRVLVAVKERSYEDSEIRQLLRASGLRLEEVRVMRRLKGRPIRKLYVAVRVAPG